MTLIEIVRQLCTAIFSELLKKLAPVYTKQHRLELFRSVFRRFGDGDPIGNVDQKDLERPSDERLVQKTLRFTDYHLSTCWPRAYVSTRCDTARCQKTLKEITPGGCGWLRQLVRSSNKSFVPPYFPTLLPERH